MSTDIGVAQIPDGEDIKVVSNAACAIMEKCYDFLSTHPTPIKISTTIQNIF